MFVVIYEFQVNSGEETNFKEAWAALTKLIYTYEGSLGSRLHQAIGQNYIAYAQWPDQATFENSGNKLPEKSTIYRNQLRKSCHSINRLYEFEVEEDLLKNKPINR